MLPANTRVLYKVLLNRNLPTIVLRQTGSISTAVPLNPTNTNQKKNWNKLVTTQASIVNNVSGILCSQFCTNMAANPIATYEEVKELPSHPEKLLIDVREPHELQETGQIPTSINIPLGDVGSAFSDNTSTKAFERLYGRPKPDSDDYLILSCRSGRRSQMAIDIIEKLGYTNARNYKGSWTEWAEKEGLPK